MNVLYKTSAKDGHAAPLDGALDVKLATPKELGGGGGPGNNPEQLFAAGCSACFLCAVKMAAARRRIELPDCVAVEAEVDLGLVQSAWRLAARIDVQLPGMDTEAARWLVESASHTCPYSSAVRGNIGVRYSADTRASAELAA